MEMMIQLSQINNELLLLTKNDIPFVEAQITIHQPTLKEIGFIGEDMFFTGCQFLNFSKDFLAPEDKVNLVDTSDFEIFMSIVNSGLDERYSESIRLVLSLLFPQHEIRYDDSSIILFNEQGLSRIDNTNYDIFKNIIVEMFELDDSTTSAQGYNPVDKRAARIAEKLQKRKKKEDKEEKPKINILSRFLSILTVGENKNMNDFLDYTVFQLKDEFKRFQKKQSFDMYLQAKMAGAEDLDDVDNWMDDIHS